MSNYITAKKVNFKPTGFKVLIQAEEVLTETESGIVFASNEYKEREENGIDIGKVLAFGPIAYKGYAGCNGPEDWGVKVGDKVEFVRNFGKKSRLAIDRKECANWRIINDSDIVGVIEVVNN